MNLNRRRRDNVPRPLDRLVVAGLVAVCVIVPTFGATVFAAPYPDDPPASSVAPVDETVPDPYSSTVPPPVESTLPTPATTVPPASSTVPPAPSTTTVAETVAPLPNPCIDRPADVEACGFRLGPPPVPPTVDRVPPAPPAGPRLPDTGPREALLYTLAAIGALCVGLGVFLLLILATTGRRDVVDVWREIRADR